MSRITSLADDLAAILGCTSLHMTLVPKLAAVGIEIPNATESTVAIGSLLQNIPLGLKLPIALGQDIAGGSVLADLSKAPHLLIAGTTGSGKSMCLNCIISSLLVANTPDQLELVLIDSKHVEFTAYSSLPHLKTAVISNIFHAANALTMVAREMDMRYERWARASVRHIEEYNAKFSQNPVPYIVVVIDELANLMLLSSAQIEAILTRLARDARPTGIHLIVSTQRPSTAVVTRTITVNLTSRIAFAVASRSDSRAILDIAGAEELLGNGDMLYLPPNVREPMRLQGAFIAELEVKRLVSFWTEQARTNGYTAMNSAQAVENRKERAITKDDIDVLWYEAAQFLLYSVAKERNSRVGSTAALQARLSIGHPRALRLMSQLEKLEIVGPNEGIMPRNVTIKSDADLEQIAERIGHPSPKDRFAQ